MKKESSRIREQGTKVFETRTNGDKITAARIVKTSKQFAKVDGIMLDLFTASAIVNVYDGLSDQNKEKFVALPIRKMASVALKLIK